MILKRDVRKKLSNMRFWFLGGVNVVQYLPWSKQTLNSCIEASNAGRIPIIDLELTAKCSAAACVYCDSMPEVCSNPKDDELALDITLDMLHQTKEKGLKWIYTCGLGEPLEDKRFLAILDFIKDNNISLSMFTNGQFIKNIDIAKRLKESNVNLILKMDTFDEDKFDYILGGVGRAQKVYDAIDFLLEAGYTNVGQVGYTDLAFSIVPTTISKGTIPKVVDFCLHHNIFPSVGELEKAGNVVNNNLFESLGLSEDCLNSVRNKTELAKINYMRPICPAILTGIHIDNKGNCVVDEVTGLNCKWFLLVDPHTKLLGNIKDATITELYSKVKEYRNVCWENNIDIIDEYENINYVFGGCGGNPSEIIRIYKEMSGF